MTPLLLALSLTLSHSDGGAPDAGALEVAQSAVHIAPGDEDGLVDGGCSATAASPLLGFALLALGRRGSRKLRAALP